MGRPKKVVDEVAAVDEKQAVNGVNIESGTYQFTPTREEFIRTTAVGLLFELAKHSGKVNTDYPDIVVDRATALADKLGIGVKAVPVKKAKLINLVEEIDNEG